MMPLSKQDVLSRMEALFEEYVANNAFEPGWLIEHFAELLDKYANVEDLYVPSDILISKLNEYTAWCAEHNDNEEGSGELMEQIAALTFEAVGGYDSIKSYRSVESQLDLVIRGTSTRWKIFLSYLGIKHDARTIVIEAKNESTPVSANQMSRLCGILQNKFINDSCLGIFFSRSGASGFSAPGGGRRRSLSDARATQVIFHARTHKYVVVLDNADIRRLTERGALPRLLNAKIREVEELTGLPVIFTEDWEEMQDLPEHIALYLRQERD